MAENLARRLETRREKDEKDLLDAGVIHQAIGKRRMMNVFFYRAVCLHSCA